MTCDVIWCTFYRQVYNDSKEGWSVSRRVSVHPSVNVEIDVCMLTQIHCNLRFIQLRVHAHCAIVAKVQ